MTTRLKMTPQEYMEEVLQYCDYIGVYEYAKYFNPSDVGNAIADVIMIAYKRGQSYHKVSIILFSAFHEKLKNELSERFDDPELAEYMKIVMDYAEYIGVPQYVEFYRAEDVARSFRLSMIKSYILDLSPRMAAIVLFSTTIHKVTDMNKDKVKN